MHLCFIFCLHVSISKQALMAMKMDPSRLFRGGFRIFLGKILARRAEKSVMFER